MKSIYVLCFTLISMNARAEELVRRISCAEEGTGLPYEMSIASPTRALDYGVAGGPYEITKKLAPLSDRGQSYAAVSIGSGSYMVFQAIPLHFVEQVLAAKSQADFFAIPPATGTLIYSDLDGPNGAILESRKPLVCEVSHEGVPRYPRTGEEGQDRDPRN